MFVGNDKGQVLIIIVIIIIMFTIVYHNHGQVLKIVNFAGGQPNNSSSRQAPVLVEELQVLDLFTMVMVVMMIMTTMLMFKTN